MQEHTSQKQAYLRRQIIEEGYSAEDFFEYLVSLKKDGSNIESWTIQELEAVVRDYKSKQAESGSKSRLSQERALANYEMVTNKQIISIFQEKERRVEYDNYNLFDVAVSKKLDSTPFRGFLNVYPPPQVFVEKPEVKINPGLLFGFGRSAELWYVVRCNVSSVSSVKRSDGDMDWLRTTLIRLYPGHIVQRLATQIPPFQKCITDLEQEDKRSLERRVRLCQYYLRSLAQHRIIFNTKIFVAFVSWPDYNKFSEMKKQYDKLAAPKTLEETPSENGVELQLSTRNRCIIKAVDVFSKSMDSLHDKAQSQLANLGRDLEKAAETMLKLSNSFAEMQEHYSNMVNYAPEAKCDSFSEVVITLNNVLHGWGKLHQELRRSIGEQTAMLFSYSRQENQLVRDFLKKRNDLEDSYLRQKADLLQKKSKMYLDPSQWSIPPNVLSRVKNVRELSREEVMQILLPKETKQEAHTREYLSFLNKSCEKEFMRMMEVLANRLRQVFGQLYEPLTDNTRKQCDLLKRLRCQQELLQNKKN